MSTNAKDAGEAGTAPAGGTPIIIDLGKQSRKRIKALKRGEGVFVKEVLPAIEQVRARIGNDPGPMQPVVVIYEKKAKKRRSPFDLLP